MMHMSDEGSFPSHSGGGGSGTGSQNSDDPFDALCHGQVQIFRDALVRQPHLIDSRDGDGASVLHWCAWHGLPELAAEFIRLRPGQIDCQTKTGQTPLMWTCTRNKNTREGVVMMRLFLKAGANIEARDANGATAFLIAAQFNCRLGALFLQLSGAKVDVTDNLGQTAAHWAAYQGNEDIIFLLKASDFPDFNARDHLGMTPLHRAAQKGRTLIIKILVDRPKNRCGVNPSATDNNGMTAADIAEALMEEEAAKQLRKSMKPLRRFYRDQPSIRVPIWYFSMMAVCFILWLFYLLPATYAEHSRLHNVAIVLLVIYLVILALISRKDPGTVSTEGNRRILKSKLQELSMSSLPDPSKICYTCAVEKPERSKHCSVCNLCRYRFDHHCNWIGSCVAEDNTREFTLYLNLQVVGHTMFLYMCYLVGLAYQVPDSMSSWTGLILVILSLICNTFGLGFALFMSRQTFFEMFGNYTTNEAINWRKFPHMRIDAPDGRKLFSNPYDNGAMLNVIEFWTRPSKRRVYNSCGKRKIATNQKPTTLVQRLMGA